MKTVIIALLACITWYFIFSFICWDLNPAEWNTFSRIIFSLFLIIVVGASLNEEIKS